MAKLTSFPKEIGYTDRDKARIWFSCHPDDFEKWFDVICKDIRECHADSIIWYKDDMGGMLEEEEYEKLQSRMNLFVCLLSDNLLKNKDSVTHKEFRLAKEKHIPVLPICVKDISGKYSADIIKRQLFVSEVNKQFECAHFIQKNSKEYKTVLADHLKRDLVDPADIQAIKESFAAYIFLSYRKQDRKHVLKLIEMMKEIDELWDVAIWFDDYLASGEDFNEGIAEAIKKCKLFNLVVTPNLLEPDCEGKPNYVMDKEYPMAENDYRKPILPAEMEYTSQKDLGDKYRNIPECIDPNKEKERYKEVLKEKIMSAIENSKRDSEEHNFWIGLAYMLGIDCIRDYEMAAKLIVPEAQKGNDQAIDKVEGLYLAGFDVDFETVKEIRKLKFDRLKALFEMNHEIGILKDFCAFVARSYDFYIKRSVRYDDEINALTEYLEAVSEENSLYRRVFAAFYEELSKKSESVSLDEFLVYYGKSAEQSKIFAEETGCTDYEFLFGLAQMCHNLYAVCCEDYGYTDELFKDISDIDERKRKLYEMAKKYAEMSIFYYEKLVTKYEKFATMPDEARKLVGQFIQYCDEYAQYFTDIKEYCFKKCIEGYKIKKKGFGLSDEDERNRRKINKDLRLLRKSKRNS